MNTIFEGIEIVAFDIMGVILPNPSLVREGLYPIYKDRYSYEYIKELYNDVRSNVDGDRALWKGLGIDEVELARKGFLDTFKVDENFQSFRDYLGKENIRKGVISNMPKEWGDYLVSKLKLSADFGPIILSGEIGIPKPDNGIYEEFIERSGVNGKGVLFIDDKLENLIMAERFGFKTVLFDRGREQEGFEPNVKISSFKELM
jgi:putative hydrolase of the HAD superfamily